MLTSAQQKNWPEQYLGDLEWTQLKFSNKLQQIDDNDMMPYVHNSDGMASV